MALKVQNYRGHSTDDQASAEELLASPQFVEDSAYAILAGGGNPAPLLPPLPALPFHQPLEVLRRLFGSFDAALPRVMESLRKADSLERANDTDYGWRDIWMEELKLSRAEYALLSDRTLTLQRLYGFPAATQDAEVLTMLSNAKAFTRRLDISYDDLISILRTRFVNPHGGLIPKLERLRVPLKTIKAFKEGGITQQQFEQALAPQLDAAQYGNDIKAWILNQANYDKIMSLMVLADPSGSNDVGSFDRLEFRYADPARLANQVRPFEFVRLLRFIRLWKKLGWSIEHTDKAITALYPPDQAPDDANDAVNLQRLDAGFLVLLPRLGVVRRVIDRLTVRAEDDLLPLLACFAPLDQYGQLSLYRRLFLNPSLLKQDPVFSDGGYGSFLDGNDRLFDHQEALRAALTLTNDEFMRICGALGFDANTKLSVSSISEIFRRGWLARKLKLSVQELLLLARYSGIDPYAPIDPVAPAMLAFIEFVQQLHTGEMKPSQTLFLIWNEDISRKSAPEAGQINDFAGSLRAGFAAVELEFAVTDDPDGQKTRERVALVYDSATTDLFFGLLNNTLVSDVPYNHDHPVLEQPILDAARGQIRYDDFRKRLTFGGVVTSTLRDALRAVAGVTDEFKTAITNLYDQNQQVVAPFFERYPELKSLYETYVASVATLEERRMALLKSILPVLKQRRKRQQALQAISAAAKIDTAFAERILGTASVLHAAADPTQPALEDLSALEQAGLSVQFFLRDSATGNVDRSSDADARLDHSATSENRLPGNNGNLISGIWSGYLEAPAGDFYNLRIEADAGAGVTLSLGGVELALTQRGNVWTNATPIELRAGTLYALSLKVERVSATMRMQWQSKGRGWEIIPPRYLYSSALCDRLSLTYTRLFKTVSLTEALKLTAGEVAYLGSHVDYQIDGQGWLNSLPVDGSPDQPTAKALHKSLRGLLGFAHLKAALGPDDQDDQRLLTVFVDPEKAAGETDGLLFTLTRWEPASLTALLARFGKTHLDLAHLETLLRVFDASRWLAALGISATALLAVTTNAPSASVTRDLQAALRARYAERDWLSAIKPINDELRSLQRDALVAYILHQMRSDPASAHIDTADKLFEYFLMDVQMAPCMQTSRIRHALSSVQLFIERCLMNIEPRVAASAINAKQWEWMRRYRVWEANRKIFLWPENWLEPELRDDQSPFFKELMSDLLQGDITEDKAAAALGDYLAKLTEVAKLEPCGIHFVENDAGTADDVAHVVARTTGASRKYFYRRREHGSWTPWEKINLDIEDNPVIPVVWKNRLFLFWLRILKQVLQSKQKPINVKEGDDTNLNQIKVSQINTDSPNVKVQALLCWSEHHNGKWQATKTSDPSKPFDFSISGVYPLSGQNAFDRSQLRITVSETENDGLWVAVTDRSFHQLGKSSKPNWISAVFYNSYGNPASAPSTLKRKAGGPRRRLILEPRGNAPLKVLYGGDTSVLRSVLASKEEQLPRTVEPAHRLADAWTAPFFSEDIRHVFYVTTVETPVTVPQFQGYGSSDRRPRTSVTDIPPIVMAKPPEFKIPDLIGPVAHEQHFSTDVPLAMGRFVSEDARIKKGIGAADTTSYGNVEIGPAGGLDLQR
jgi:hypothetical protein